MKKVLISVFCLFSIFAHGQMVDVVEKPSGYFGKRLLIGFSGSFSGSLNYQKAYEIKPERTITLNRDFFAFLQYTFKHDKSVGFIVGSGKTSCDPTSISNGSGELIIKDDKGKQYLYSGSIGTPLIKDRQIGIEIKSYLSKKGAFSPIGRYYSFGFVGHFFKTDFSSLSYSVYGQNASQSVVIKSSVEPLKMLLPEFYVSAGFSKPIFKIMFLDANVKFGYLFTFRSPYSPDSESADLKDAFKPGIKDRLRKREIINFNLGLAYPF
jgi:hypothetical protein